MKKIILLLFVCLSIMDAMGATRRWKGTTGDGLWSTTGNWHNGNIAVGVDLALFDGNGGGNGSANASNAAGTTLHCIDLGGATITVNKLTIRDGAKVKFINGTLNVIDGVSVADGSTLDINCSSNLLVTTNIGNCTGTPDSYDLEDQHTFASASVGNSIVTYYASNQDAIGSINPLPSSVVTTSGTYYVRYDTDLDFDDDFDGCVNIEAINIAIGAPLCSIVGSTLVENNMQNAMYMGPAGMDSYVWSITGGDATIEGSTNSQNVTIDFGTSSSILELTIEDEFGCTATCRLEVLISQCDCTEYIYLNEPNADAVLKFEVDPGMVALTNVAGAGNAFIDDNALIGFPHGVIMDPNGNLWVGSTQASGDPIRKFNCEGEYIGNPGLPDPAAGVAGTEDVVNTAGILTNLFYANGFLYGNSANDGGTSTDKGGPTKFDPCTGLQIGSNVCLNTPGTSGLAWGMWYDEATGYVYTTANGTNGSVYRYTLAEVDAAVLSGQCFDPIITNLFANGRPGSNINRIFGVTTDAAGNTYVVARHNSSLEGQIFKYDPLGVFVDTSTIDTLIYPDLMGIVYSASTNQLYVSTANVTGTDCIAVFNTDLDYLGTGAPNGASASERGKGIAIIKECCPTPGNTTFNYSYCAEDFPEILELSQLYQCEGVVCEAPWELEAGAMGVTYDDCKEAIIELTPDFELTGGCVTLTKEYTPPVGGTARCAAFKITINIEIVKKATSTIATPSICGGVVSAITSDTTDPGQATDMVTYQWQQSTPPGAFVNIPTATSNTYTPTTTPLTTQCFRLITTTTGSCVAAPDNATCSDTSNVVKYTSISAPTLITLDTAVCSGTVDVTASVFSMPNPTGGDLSYHGSAADAMNDANPLTGPPITQVSTSDTIYLRYELSTGCFITDSIEVMVNANPTLVTLDTAVCSGTMVDVTANVFSMRNPTGGDLSYYRTAIEATMGINALSGTAITEVGATSTIHVRYELGTGCFVTDLIEVTVNANPTLMTLDTAACIGTMVDVTASVFSTVSPAGGLPLSYHGSAADATNNASPLTGTTITEVTSGKIYVRYELGRGCFATDSIEVTVSSNPTLTSTTTCSSDFMTYTITFISDGSVASTAGAVDNTAKTVSNIPLGTNVRLTATLNGCATMLDVTSPECPADDSEPIPTMNEWGLMIFGLLILNLGIFFLYRKERMFTLPY